MIDFNQFINENLNEAFKFTEEQVVDVANLIAAAISKLDKVSAEVHDLEFDKGRGAGFEISMDGEKYAGGSYSVRPNGDVVNDAIGNSAPNAVYAKIGDSDIKKVMKNIQQFESVVTEAKKFYTTKEIVKLAQAAGDFVLDAKDAIQDLSVAYGDKVPAKELDKVLANYDLELEDLMEAYDGNASDFKYEFPLKFEEATGNSTKAIKKIGKKGKGFEVRTSTYMSEPEMKKVADAMGMELKSYEKGMNVAISVFEAVENITEGRSINKIQKEWAKVTADMAALAKEYSAAEGDAKAKILVTLKELTATKKSLERELDDAVSGKDKDVQLAIKESKVILKRRYTENHPAITAGKHASIRNKMLEAIKDGQITQEEFDNILKELSSDSKRWMRTNSKYFNVSEEGISLSKFGRRALASITVNEKTEKNPEVWVPGAFDKALSKMPNSKITYDVVKDLAKKHKVFLDDAIAYVEYGWDLDLQENKNNQMKSNFIYESFSSFVENELNEAKFNKKSLMKALKGDDGIILVNGQEYIIYNPNNNNDDNAAMWGNDTIIALDQDGEEHEFKYSDIERFSESVVTEAKLKADKKAYKELSQAINKANEAEDIWNQLDPKMFDVELAEFEDIFDSWWNSNSTYDSVADFANNATTQDVESLLSHMVKSMNESVELNEAFKSNKLASLFRNTRGQIDKNLAQAFYRMSKIKMDQVEDHDIIEMDPKTAYKDKRESAVYFYFTHNEKENPYATSEYADDRRIPANTLLAITNGKNEFYGVNWKRFGEKGYVMSLGSVGDSAGIGKSHSRYGGTGLSNMKRVSDVADVAYVLDLNVLRNRYDVSALKDTRSAAKAGAIAFKTDKEFKQENLNRYNTIIANRAAEMPIDKMVADAIDTLSAQIKDALAKGEKTRYNEILLGRTPKGREAKISDAANHMQRILDDFQRYVSYTNQAEEEKKAGYGGDYYAREVKNYAKSITDRIKQIETFSYAW